MRISTRGHYGLRAMVELANTKGSEPVALGDIAQSEHISVGYLEQIFSALKRAGLVTSTRGTKGGYQLAQPPSSVTVGDVLRVLEGPLVIAECASEIAEPGCCERERACASRVVWQRMRDSIVGVLNGTTLADLCRDQPPLLRVPVSSDSGDF
ncbi:MAG: Rrf2 family transcriptional regulator [Chloroflexi bacterium]|nr:Rrf2 family transcriptional regulator [Chloroflexota bacterium]